MNPGPTFDRVYTALKEQLGSGRFRPGDHLEPAALGEKLNASITPVRDALHRLVGERIVEAPRNDGFRVPSPLEAELRELYAWNARLLELAIRSGGRSAVAAHAGTAQPTHSRAADLFRRIASLAGSAEHEAAINNLNDRLAALRTAEARIFDDVAGELAEMSAALDNADLPGLRRHLSAYHRRRRRCVPEILAAARRPPELR